MDVSPPAAALRAQLEAQRDAIERLYCGRPEWVYASPLYCLLAHGQSVRPLALFEYLLWAARGAPEERVHQLESQNRPCHALRSAMRLAVAFVLLLVLTASVHAQTSPTVVLAWDPPRDATGQVPPGLTGYQLQRCTVLAGPNSCTPEDRLQLELSSEWWMAGLRYLSRQASGVNGTIAGFRIEVSRDGATWQEVARGTWPAAGKDWRGEEMLTLYRRWCSKCQYYQ
jgi:hypothetical protein